MLLNDLVLVERQLPDTLPDLAKFALIGRDKLKAVKAEISAIEKVGLAREVLEQKRAEAQEIAELVTLSEVRIGEMIASIPKVSGGDHGNQYTSGKKDTAVPFATPTKSEILEQDGRNTRR